MDGKLILAAIITILIIGFLVTRDPGTPKPANFSNVIITLDRTACYGFCPAYSLIIYGNGTVVYEGRMFVNVTGKHTSQISKDKVDELVNEFYSVNYFFFSDRYVEPPDMTVSDLPSITTSITINGVTKTVFDYYNAPSELRNLENKIDEIAESYQWIKCEGYCPQYK